MIGSPPEERETIFAPATAPGRSGVAIIRVSGSQTATVFKSMTGSDPRSGAARLHALRNGRGEIIDQAVCLFFKGPNSFTGEDVAEFQVHGSVAVIAASLQRLSELSLCRLAEPGEFARRAFENGKMDLSAIEGLADLIDAETEIQREQALRQLQGGLTRLSDQWRDGLISALALFDAALDFADEADIGSDSLDQARQILMRIRVEMRSALEHSSWGERVRDGFVVLLAGPPNAGKSTLLNALTQRDVAIVSDRPGTTRDLIEVKLDLAGMPVILIDSAGIRSSEDDVEQEGVRRSLRQAARADLVLWLESAHEKALGPPAEILSSGRPVMRLRTQSDRVSQSGTDEFLISAKTGAGLSVLIERMTDHFLELGRRGSVSAVLTRERHRVAVKEALEFIDSALDWEQGLSAELLAEEIRLAARAIGRITGHIAVDDVLDRLFSTFCIGK